MFTQYLFLAATCYGGAERNNAIGAIMKHPKQQAIRSE